MLQNHLRKNRLRKHYLNAQNPGASLGPPPGLCPGPTGDLKRSQDPLPNFVPLTSNPGSTPVSVCPSVVLRPTGKSLLWRRLYCRLWAPNLDTFSCHICCEMGVLFFCCLIRRTVSVYCSSFSRQARVNEDIFLPKFLRCGPIWNKLFKILI